MQQSVSFLIHHQFSPNAPSDSCGGSLDRVPGQMRVSGGRLNLGMAGQLPDHREALAYSQCPRGIRAPKDVNPHVVQMGRTQMRWEGH